MRLANGSVAQEGRVEICMSGIWGGVCSDAWDRSDALVVCSQLGLGIAEPIVYTDSSAYSEVFGPLIYSNTSCNGYEIMFASCMKNTYPNMQCNRNQVAGVFCRDGMQFSLCLCFSLSLSLRPSLSPFSLSLFILSSFLSFLFRLY